MRWYSLTLIVLFIVLFAAPLFTDRNPRATNPENQLLQPSITHPLGTDYLGRDVFVRVLYGGQRTILIATAATTIAVSIGLFFGVLASYTLIKQPTTMLIDALLAFPSLLLALVILTLLGRGSISIAIAVGVSQSPFFARMTRATIQSILSEGYIESAKSLGATQWHILRMHILLNARPILLAYTALIFGYSIINSAALSLLGLGQDPSVPDWGTMLADGRSAFRFAPWIAIVPGLIIGLVVICINRIVDDLA